MAALQRLNNLSWEFLQLSGLRRLILPLNIIEINKHIQLSSLLLPSPQDQRSSHGNLTAILSAALASRLRKVLISFGNGCILLLGKISKCKQIHQKLNPINFTFYKVQKSIKVKAGQRILQIFSKQFTSLSKNPLFNFFMILLHVNQISRYILIIFNV